MYCIHNVLSMSDYLSLVSFSALGKISDGKILKRLLLSKFSSNFNQILWKVW